MIRALKWSAFFMFYVVTIVPGVALMAVSLGDFNYIAIGEAVQEWAERPSRRGDRKRRAGRGI